MSFWELALWVVGGGVLALFVTLVVASIIVAIREVGKRK